MSLYKKLRDEKSRCFEVNVDANIDPCQTCVVKDSKAPEHCEDCENNRFFKEDEKEDIPIKHINSIVILS